MKFTTVAKSLMLGAALMLASSAFAVTKANIELTSTATINGTTLQAGSYKLVWDGSGPNVEVSVLKGKNVIAKAPAKVVDLATPSAGDAVVFSNENGSNAVSAVRFNGKKYALDLNPAAGGMQGEASK